MRIECIGKRFGRQSDWKIIRNSQNLRQISNKTYWFWVIFHYLCERHPRKKVSSIMKRAEKIGLRFSFIWL